MKGVWRLYRGVEEEKEGLGWTRGICTLFLPLLTADTPQPPVSAAFPVDPPLLCDARPLKKEMLKVGRELVRH